MKGTSTQSENNFVEAINGYNKATIVGLDRYNDRDQVLLDAGFPMPCKFYVSSKTDEPMADRCNAVFKACGMPEAPVGTDAAKIEAALNKCIGKEVALLLVKGEPNANGKRYFNPYILSNEQPVVAPLAMVGTKFTGEVSEDAPAQQTQNDPDDMPF